MKKLLKWFSIIVGILALAIAVFWFMYIRNLPKIEIALKPIKFTGVEKPGSHDCFWMGPVSIDSFNTAYPDGGALYWPTVFKFPDDADAYLEIRGKFPQARYMSLHSYTTGAKPYDSLTDIDVRPDTGNSNPYLTGRHEDEQNYTLKIMPGVTPNTKQPNTIYLGPREDISTTPLILRVYVPETKEDPTGGSGLPAVTLVRGNGERVTGKKLCAELKNPKVGSPERLIAAPVIPMESYKKMMAIREVRESMLESKEDEWTIFWDPRIGVLRISAPTLGWMMRKVAGTGLIKKTSGYFANFDNEYVSLYLNEKFGEVVVLEGKMPHTPTKGTQWSDSSKYDLRYWSLCTNEGLATTRFSDCVYDSNVVVDANRDYKIVISKKANRPDNATKECGITWLDWGDKGDGAGNENITLLLLRNMLATPNFKQAIQRVPAVGKEKSTMGAYLPKPAYSSKAGFEEHGC